MRIENQLLCGHASVVLAPFPDGCIDLIVTSPPYWDAVTYSGEQAPWLSYDAYLTDMQAVWFQCARVLRPNGKLCINAPIMPIPQAIIKQQTRHIKNIAADMDQRILKETDLRRYSLFI